MSERSGREKPKMNREKAVAAVAAAVEGVRLLVKQAHICGFNAPPPSPKIRYLGLRDRHTPEGSQEEASLHFLILEPLSAPPK